MLTLHQSNRLEHLARGLAEQLGRPGNDPLRPDWVVVQHPGMARWLSLQLAQTLGIAANLEFPLPAVFVWRAFRQLLGDVPELDRYQPRRLAWRIHELLTREEFGGDASPLSAYLQGGDELRRFRLAGELAALFDRYLLYRPDWIIAWEEGRSAVPGDAWQAELWRGLTRTERWHWVNLQRQLFAQALNGATGGLPSPIYLFGLPTLSPGYLQILQRLSESLHLHLFLLNPCAAHWADIVPPQTRVRGELEAAGEPLYLEVGHPLLATLGRQGRDFFAAINELDPGSEELFEAPGEVGLLGRLQQQILELEPPGGGVPVDASISLHLCHSPMREVEVLYDQLLAMFETLPGLAPDEILVMTPEIERYAPLIEAVFGEPGDRPPIPYRISDRSLRRRNPLAAALLELLALPGSRYGLTQILFLLEQPSVQRRFGLDESALGSITRWLIEAGVRWGRDGESKTAWGLPASEGNTWRMGLRRLLLGYAMPQGGGDPWRGVLPLDAAEGTAAEQLGSLLAFCDRLFALEQELAPARPVADWCDRLRQLVQEFFRSDGESQEQEDELRGVLQQLSAEAEQAGFAEAVGLPLIRERLQTLLEEADGRGFLGGGVSCCALAPMRSLPFRVICLLGMNDGDFPRRQPAPDFDLMTHRFRHGDRSRRVDDRYLFLETLVSARERLYISYVGQSQRDNSPLPPSVVVEELCDTLRAMTGDDELLGLIHRHPLQPFSTAYFEQHAGLFTYSAARHQAALLLGRGEREEGPLAAAPLSQAESGPPDTLSLERLCEFFVNPPRRFARERLQLSLEAPDDLPEEREPFELDPYLRVDEERELVEGLLQQVSPALLLERLRGGGLLPHGQAGSLEFDRMLARAEAMAARLRPLLAGTERRACDVRLSLAGGQLSGRLRDLLPAGPLAYTTDRFRPYLLLRRWIEHLALNLAAPEGIGRETQLLEAERRGRFRPPADAGALLESLLELYRAGHERPLPFYPATAWAYMEGLGKDGAAAALQRAREKWYGNQYAAGDADKAYNRLLWPDGNCFSDEFGRLAETVLGPLMGHLEWE